MHDTRTLTGPAPRDRSSRPWSWAVLFTLTVLAWALVAGTAPAAASPRAAGDAGWIRVGHLSPGTPTADVRLTPFRGGAPVRLRGVDYGDVSDFSRVPSGLYTLSMETADGGAAMLSRSVRVPAGGATTVVATGPKDDVRVQALEDDLSAPPPGDARVRLVSATGEADVSAQIADGPELARDVTPGQATGYADVAAQTWTVRVTAETADGARNLTEQVPVRAGSVYSLVVLETPAGLRLQTIADSTGTAKMPRGSVDTGAGGTAAGNPVSQGVSPATAGAVGVLGSTALGGAVLLLARRRARGAAR